MANPRIPFKVESSSPGARLFVFARHAESTANVARVVSSNPAHPVWLTAKGKLQARQLGMQLAGIDIDLAVATRLQRTQQTARLALEDRNAPLRIEPGLDEIDTGDLDHAPIEAYWDWEEHHGPSERFPHGETENEALLRYGRSLERLLGRTEPVTLVVLHQFALRRIVWVAAGFPLLADEGFGNAVPYFLGEPAVRRAAAGLVSMARCPRPEFKAREARTFQLHPRSQEEADEYHHPNTGRTRPAATVPSRREMK
jgi:broad specificity phosphatase PhoE